MHIEFIDKKKYSSKVDLEVDEYFAIRIRDYVAENEKSAPEGSIISSSSRPRFIFRDGEREATSDERNDHFDCFTKTLLRYF